MGERMITVKVFRYDPAVDKEPRYQSYAVPYQQGMSAMNALEYIYQNLDGTVAYYDHAGCCLGICGRCTARINGSPRLLCQTLIEEDTTLEPTSPSKVIKDIVSRRGERGDA
jgi:succinate dehydrogenase/fumarate reductase-like Fe-S protein